MGYISIVISSFFTACNVPLIKYGSEIMPYAGLLFYRFLLAFLILFLVMFIRKSIPKSLKPIKELVLISLVSPLSIFLIVNGINRTTNYEANLILLFIPAFVGIGAIKILEENIRKSQIFGLLLGFAGILLTFVSERTGPIELGSTVVGNLLVLFGTFGVALFILLTKYYSKKYSPIQISTFTFLDNAVFWGILYFSQLKLGLIDVLIPTFGNLLLISLLAVFGSIGSFLLFQYGLTRVTAFFSGIRSYLQFPTSVLIGYFLFNEVLNRNFFISTFFIVVGALLVSGKIKKTTSEVINSEAV